MLDLVLSALADPATVDRIAGWLFAAFLTALTWLTGRAAKSVIPALRGWLGARAMAVLAEVWDAVVERAVAWALANRDPSPAPAPASQAQAVDLALAYIRKTRPDLLAKIGDDEDATRLRLGVEVLKQLRRGEQPSSPRPG